MSKKFFLIFQQINTLPPKLFKTLKSVQKYKNINPAYQIKQYDDEISANTAFDMKNIQFKKYYTSLKAQEKLINSKYLRNKSFIINNKKNTKNNINVISNQTSNIKTNQQLFSPISIKRTLAELQKQKKNLFSLTPQMPRLMHCHAPALFEYQIYPNLLYTGFFDGCTKYNPGPSGVGYFIKKDSQVHFSAAWPLGTRTNNQAQFLALLYLMVDAYINGIRRIHIYGDSKLAVCATKGEMIATSVNITDYAEACIKMSKKFDFIKLQHISRTFNSQADKLSNSALKKKFAKIGQFKGQ